MLRAVVFRTLTKSLPFDITSNQSHFNLNPSNIVIEPEAAVISPEASTTEPANTAENPLNPFKAASSALEYLYNATDTSNSFHKVVDFLGTMAEAESFKGKQTYNENSSASGIFHFLIGNGGGHDKNGKRVPLGQYDAKGVLRTSSFETAKKRLKAMMSSAKWASNIEKQPGLVSELNSVLQARTPDDLSPQRQALLAYANLKMKSGDFDNYLQGKDTAANVYGKVWVTHGKTHTPTEITSNWKNAIARSNNKSHLEYFGILPSTPHPYGANIPAPAYRSGGVILKSIIDKKTLI